VRLFILFIVISSRIIIICGDRVRTRYRPARKSEPRVKKKKESERVHHSFLEGLDAFNVHLSG
jgi:hypothetical protein